MAIIIVPRYPSSGSSSSSQSDVAIPVEVSYNTTLSALNISQALLSLPDDCVPNRAITLALNGIITSEGIDWQVIHQTSPQLDYVAWQGLGLQVVAQEGDSVSITYYRR